MRSRSSSTRSTASDAMPGARAKPILKPPLATKWPGRPGQGPTIGARCVARGRGAGPAGDDGRRREARHGGAPAGDDGVEPGVGGIRFVEVALGRRADRDPARPVRDDVEAVGVELRHGPRGRLRRPRPGPLTPLPTGRPRASDSSRRPSQPVAWTTGPRSMPSLRDLAARLRDRRRECGDGAGRVELGRERVDHPPTGGRHGRPVSRIVGDPPLCLAPPERPRRLGACLGPGQRDRVGNRLDPARTPVAGRKPRGLLDEGPVASRGKQAVELKRLHLGPVLRRMGGEGADDAARGAAARTARVDHPHPGAPPQRLPRHREPEDARAAHGDVLPLPSPALRHSGWRWV